MPQPLEGIRVVDLGTFLAAPIAASLLGDFGAEVIKIELPTGDAYREGKRKDDGRGFIYLVESRNKLSVTLDVRTASGRSLLDRLLAVSDVVVLNFRPPTLSRLELGPDLLTARFPQLVALYVSGYGQSGPYKDRGAFDRVASAFAGLTAGTGELDGEPIRSGYPVVDYMAGYVGAFATMLALYYRDVHGAGGQAIDLALYEPAFRATESAFLDWMIHGRERQRTGNRNLDVVPAENFKTADEVYVTIHAAYGHLFHRLLKVIDRLDLVDDERFATESARREHQDELYAILAAWARSRTADEVLDALHTADVPAARVMSMADIASDPHFRERTLESFDDEEWGRVDLAKVIPRLSGSPGSIRWLGQTLGKGNRYVFEQILGLSESQLADLRREGVI